MIRRRERRGSRLGVGESRAGAIGLGTAAWVIGMLWIFPVAWTLLTSFKTEQDAAAQTLHQGLTVARYSDVSHSTQGTLSLGVFLSKTKMQIHEDLTGYVLDVLVPERVLEAIVATTRE